MADDTCYYVLETLSGASLVIGLYKIKKSPSSIASKYISPSATGQKVFMHVFGLMKSLIHFGQQGMKVKCINYILHS